MTMRIGHGYDVHRLVEGRKLILGGVEVPHTLGLLGHSDADVLTHAVMDALLGAAALGDIGRHFPDTDPAYAGADSLKLLDRVVELLEEAGQPGRPHESGPGPGEREGHHRGEAGLHRRGGGHRRPRRRPTFFGKKVGKETFCETSFRLFSP